jgi:glycosyltransferase involved in cell wall biosynthesis
MKILFICNEYPPFPYGGIGVFVKNIANELVQRGFDCTVLGIYPIESKSDEMIDGIRVIRLKEMKHPFFNQIKLLRMVQNIINKWKLSRFLSRFERQHKTDIIESYDWNGPLAYKPKTKLIVRLHGSNSAHAEFEKKKANRLIRFFENRNIQFADEVISVSDHMLKISEKTFGKIDAPTSVIYNSYNEKIFNVEKGTTRQNNLLLFVGKFHERKGVFELFHILNVLFSLNDDYLFHFVGSHDDRNREELLALLNPEYRDKVKFTHSIQQSELAWIYKESTLMIMPSRAEAFGLTVIEAMACGCVVAMNDLPVAHEIIDDNATGLIIDSNDYRSSAIKIHELISDKAKLKQFSIEANMQVEAKFSTQEILNLNIKEYSKNVEDTLS